MFLIIPPRKAVPVVLIGVIIVVALRFSLGQVYPELLSAKATILGGVGLGISALICSILLLHMRRSTQAALFGGLLGVSWSKLLEELSSQTPADMFGSLGKVVSTLVVALTSLFGGLRPDDAGLLVWGFVSTTIAIMLVSFFVKHDVDAGLAKIVERLKKTGQPVTTAEMDWMRSIIEEKL